MGKIYRETDSGQNYNSRRRAVASLVGGATAAFQLLPPNARLLGR
jgi:hypothetical protein